MGCLLLINCVQGLFVLMACCPGGETLRLAVPFRIVADAAAPGKGGSWPFPHGFAAGCGLAFPAECRLTLCIFCCLRIASFGPMAGMAGTDKTKVTHLSVL